MDGPTHFLHGAAGIDEMPLTATMGKARVIEIEHPREVTVGEIRKHGLQAGEQLCSLWVSGSEVTNIPIR